MSWTARESTDFPGCRRRHSRADAGYATDPMRPACPRVLSSLVALACIASAAASVSAQKLAIYVLAGQSTRIQADKVAATGHYYRLMIEHVRRVLADLPRVCPAYDAEQGHELAGFVWFQGWNDMVDGGTYPERDQPGGYDRYSECLAHLIRDVRRDLGAPGLPFVIGVMGVDGPVAPGNDRRKVHRNFQAAMAAPAALGEFRGNVAAVPTAPFWPAELAAIAAKVEQVRHMERMLKNKDENAANRDGTMSEAEQRAWIDRYRAESISSAEQSAFARGASNGGYHYLGCAKTLAQIGVAFADAMLALEQARGR